MKLQRRNNLLKSIYRKSNNKSLTQLSKHQRITEAAFQTSNITNVNQQKNVESIKQIRTKWFLKRLVREFKALIPFKYEKSFNFQQQWQKQEDFENDKETQSFLFYFSDKFFFLFEIITVTLNVIMMWYMTIFINFDMEPLNNFQIVWQLNFILNIIMNLNTVRVINNRMIFNRKQIFKIYLETQCVFDLVAFVYILLKNTIQQKNILRVYQIILVLCIFIKTRRSFNKIEPLYQRYLEKQYITLIHSFLFLIMMGHIFAVVMFASSKLNSQVNWVLAINLQYKPWQIQYIYSLYWAFTTMVTVGYGDITPKNQHEIIIVIIIQILGTSLFGYMINIIGITISDLKKHDERLQKQLRISQKISKCFELNDELSYQLKMNIRNNKKIDKSFSILQQKQLLENIHPQLRFEIFRETNTKIIKKSIFFLTHFSKEFQTKISLKLIKKILQPRQQIIQHFNQQSFYIIHKGIIDVDYVKFHQNKRIQKRVKCIKRQDSDSTYSNLYGYTAVITGKTVNLIATSKDFTIAYELKKKDFKQAILNYPSENQILSQLRDRFLQVKLIESIQGPKLKQFEFHYLPNKFLVIKKTKLNTRQARQYRRRSDMKTNVRNYLHINQQAVFIDKQESADERTSSLKFAGSKKSIQKSKTLQQNLQVPTQNDLYSIDRLQQKNIHIDNVKSYQKYFVRSNIDKILEKYRTIKQKKHSNKKN